jgi:hypothetical protein
MSTTNSTTDGTTTKLNNPQAQGKTVRVLHSTSDTVRGQLKVGKSDGTAAVLLVDHDGTVFRTLPRIASISELRPLLTSF